MIVETEINELLNKLEKKATVDETKGEIKRLGELVEEVLEENKDLEDANDELEKELRGDLDEPNLSTEYAEFLQSGGAPMDWLMKKFDEGEVFFS